MLHVHNLTPLKENDARKQWSDGHDQLVQLETRVELPVEVGAKESLVDIALLMKSR